MIELFSPQPSLDEIPTVFPSPFCDNPHPIAVRASKLLQQKLSGAALSQLNFFNDHNGKMFGVLVVRDNLNRYGYLSAFSGMLAGDWNWPDFTPAVFSQTEQDEFWPQGEKQLDILTAKLVAEKNASEYVQACDLLHDHERQCENEQATLINEHRHNKADRKRLRIEAESRGDSSALLELSFASQRDRLARKDLRDKWQKIIEASKNQIRSFHDRQSEIEKQRLRLSRQLHKKLFDTYRLGSFERNSSTRSLRSFFTPRMPPGGTGDCAAPKLIAYAQTLQLKPIALAEFWWGASPPGEVRHHAQFYPSCRGKCAPILPYMLTGIELEASPDFYFPSDNSEPAVVFEDNDLLVVNKPAGMLSVAGKTITDSVQSRMSKRYPELPGVMLVHRLDMSTSGLLLVAKSSGIHKKLQAQFIQRTVRKCYEAVLSRRIEQDSGEIRLPLRTDFDDRPRQMVCEEHGKPALTRWRVINRTDNATRVYFYPHTGRTHQLRIHASHVRGLAAPIIGDELYGQRANRMCLHAQSLSFDHPVSGKRIELEVETPF